MSDDRGFRLTPSSSSFIGMIDDKISLKTALNLEFTYLIFNQLEFGIGAGYHRTYLSEKKDEFFGDGEGTKTVHFIRNKANAIPYYALIRYSFDINEDGFLVLTGRVGKYFINSKERNKSGQIFSSVDEGEVMPDIYYSEALSKFNFFSVSLGYDLYGTVISAEYRSLQYDHTRSYRDKTSQIKYDKNYQRVAHYIGVNVAYRIDLF